MSSLSRTAMLIDAAYMNNDAADARRIFDEYQASQCYYPQKQRVYDAHTQTTRIITVACGRCYHCMETKINEWCTRMYAHAEDFKHVYFVTLTYRSISDPTQQINKLLLNKLNGALWHLDAFNATKHKSFNPCVLVKKHYQDFIKRLRKNTGLDDITYVLSGEYGTKFGRPHFHAILFTNGTLTKADIVRAWSLCLWRNNRGEWTYRRNQRHDGQAYDFPIGRVDYNDLVENGTFNTAAKIRVDDTYMNAHQCFAYVAKYVCKRSHANTFRVRLAYDSLYKKKDYVVVSPHFEFLHYEKEFFSVACDLYSVGIKERKKVTLYGFSKDVDAFPSYYPHFCDEFSPFVEFSRGTPIGSVYATRNLSQFQEGIFTRPLLQTDGFVVPSYFRRKADESTFGLRICRRTLSGRSFAFGGLVNLCGRFEKSLANNLPPREYFTTGSGRIKDYKSVLQNPTKVFADLSTGERVILADGFARHYKYDKHKREYFSTRNVPVADWIRYWCEKLYEEFNRHELRVQVSKENDRLRECIALRLPEFVGEYNDLRDSFVQRANDWRNERQKDYDDIHKSVE